VATTSKSRESPGDTTRKETEMLKLFRANSEGTMQAVAEPPAADMYGRAAEIDDAAAYGWEVVWEALKTEPPSEDPSAITQELGLDEERSIRPGYEKRGMPATEFSGTRHGRRVALRIGIVPDIRGKGMTEVEIETAVAPFRVDAQDGRLVADPGAMPEIEEMLGEFAPAPKVWRDVVVEGGQDGIRARRPVTSHPQGYVYDLWLVEQLADRLGG
jgi:hypothetical protein